MEFFKLMRVDNRLFILSSFLIGIGIIFSYSLTTYIVRYYNLYEFSFLIKQLIVGIIAIFVMWFLSKLNPDKWLSIIGTTLFLISLIAMIVMKFLPENLVYAVGGAKRWIQLPYFSIAPVEFFKVGFVFFLAWSFERRLDSSEKPIKEELRSFTRYIITFAIIVYIIAIFQNDIGQVIVLGITLLTMALLAGMSLKFFTYSIIIVIIIVLIFIFTSDHRILRVIMWWSSVQDIFLSIFPDSIANIFKIKNIPESFQVTNSLNAIHHGSLFGEGIGEGTFKLGFLSDVHTDFVLTGIAEEAGVIGLTSIVLIYYFMLYRIFRIASRSENRIYFLFGVGVGLLFATSFIINAFGIVQITPIKGISVPFLSYGGSSLLANAIAIGMVLMISKRVKKL